MWRVNKSGRHLNFFRKSHKLRGIVQSILWLRRCTFLAYLYLPIKLEIKYKFPLNTFQENLFVSTYRNNSRKGRRYSFVFTDRYKGSLSLWIKANKRTFRYGNFPDILLGTWLYSAYLLKRSTKEIAHLSKYISKTCSVRTCNHVFSEWIEHLEVMDGFIPILEGAYSGSIVHGLTSTHCPHS